ncbi:unnamed protein product, partial [Rotaria magnacalcarata]
MYKNLQQSYEHIHIEENIINDWKELLIQWIQIHQKLSQSNSIFTSLLLHISPLLSKQKIYSYHFSDEFVSSISIKPRP